MWNAGNRLFATSAEFGANPPCTRRPRPPAGQLHRPEVRGARPDRPGRPQPRWPAAPAPPGAVAALRGTHGSRISAVAGTSDFRCRWPVGYPGPASRRGWSVHRYRRGFRTRAFRERMPLRRADTTDEGRSIPWPKAPPPTSSTSRSAPGPARARRVRPAAMAWSRGALRPRRRTAAHQPQRPRLRRGAQLRHQRGAEPADQRQGGAGAAQGHHHPPGATQTSSTSI